MIALAIGTWIYCVVLTWTYIEPTKQRGIEFSDWATSKPGWANTVNCLASIFMISVAIYAVQISNGFKQHVNGKM